MPRPGRPPPAPVPGLAAPRGGRSGSGQAPGEGWRAGRAASILKGMRMTRFVRAWVRESPGTHVWLAVLAVTSGVVACLSPAARSLLLHRNSTNLVELGRHPVRVMVVSALWIQQPGALLLYVPLFEVVHASAERWLGTRRWLAVAAAAHVGATLVSEQAVALGIRSQRLPVSMAHTVDIGVSYALAGVAGVLAYRMPWRRRRFYLAALFAFFGWPLATRGTFTDLGHFTALLFGLACYGVARTAPAARPVLGPDPLGPDPLVADPFAPAPPAAPARPTGAAPRPAPERRSVPRPAGRCPAEPCPAPGRGPRPGVPFTAPSAGPAERPAPGRPLTGSPGDRSAAGTRRSPAGPE